MSATILLLYGLCALGAALNLPAWASLWWQRWQAPDRTAWWRDTYLMTRSGITLLSFGAAGLAGLRTVAAVFGEVRLELPSPAGLLFIGSMAAAEPLFLWVGELHAHGRGERSLIWRLYLATALTWAATVIVIGMQN